MDKCPHCLVPVPKMVVSCAHCDELLEFNLAGLGEKETLPSDAIPAEGSVKETARQLLTRLVVRSNQTNNVGVMYNYDYFYAQAGLEYRL